MRYEPREPDDSVNVSPVHPLREAVVLVLGVAGVLALLVVVAAFGVDLALHLVPPDFEARVFAGLPWEEVFELAPEAEDTARTASVEKLLDRLVALWPDCPYRFRVAILASADVNALAVPGGTILVTQGLLDGVESENELAMVLGHELGHFQSRDHLRSLGRGLVYSLALAAVLGRTSGPGIDLAQLGGELASRGFDREQESDADRFGLELVHRLYGHVNGSWDFFDRVAEQDPGSEAPLTEYLSTHPHLTERAEEVRLFAQEQGWLRSGPRVSWP